MKLSPKQKESVYQKICSVIRKSKTFFLAGHRKPDGDTVASELAIASLLRRLGKSVDIYNAERVPPYLLFLPGVSKIKTAQKVEKIYDAAIIFECADQNRMGNVIDLEKQAETVINIDHHLKYSLYGDINLVDTKASSNSEQLLRLFEKMKMPLTQNEASCLYLGMMYDTGRFQYSNTNSHTLHIASQLLKSGGKVDWLCENLYNRHTLASLKLLGIAFSDLKIEGNGKIAVIELTGKDFQKTGSSREDTEEIVNYGLHVPGVLISILFREEEDGRIKVSFRSKKGSNVCKLAESFGGGGHKQAAGCTVSGNINSVKKKVLKAAKKLV